MENTLYNQFKEQGFHEDIIREKLTVLGSKFKEQGFHEEIIQQKLGLPELAQEKPAPSDTDAKPEPTEAYLSTHPKPDAPGLLTGFKALIPIYGDKAQKEIEHYDDYTRAEREFKDKSGDGGVLNRVNLALSNQQKFLEDPSAALEETLDSVWNSGKEDVGYSSDEEKASVSSFSNPQDPTLIETVRGAVSDDFKRPETLDEDIKNYRSSVEKKLGSKYDIRYDDEGYPEVKPKGEDKPFKPVLNTLENMTWEEAKTRIWANRETWGFGMIGDAAGTQAAWKATKGVKNPALRIAITMVGGLTAGSLTEGAGTVAQSVRAGEDKSLRRTGEHAVQTSVDTLAAGLTLVGMFETGKVALKTGVKTGRFLGRNNPLHTVKGGAKKYTEQVVDPLPKKGAQRTEEILIRAKDEADLAATYKIFGGNEDAIKVGKLASHQETRNVMGDIYASKVAMTRATFDNSVKLTENLQQALNIDKKSSKDIFLFLQDGVKGIKEHYANQLDAVAKIIEEEVGTSPVHIRPSTVKVLDDLTHEAKYPKNVENTELSEALTNEFNRDYQTILDSVKRLLVRGEDEAVSSYSINGMNRVKKTFNDFFYKHSDKFTYEQKKSLSTLKEAIYDDIDTGITRLLQGKKGGDELSRAWREVNREYASYKDIFKNKAIFKALASKDSELDFKKVVTDMIKGINKVDGDDLDGLSVLAKEMQKTQPEKLEEFYSSVINAFIDNSKRVSLQGRELEFIDFKKFEELYNGVEPAHLKRVFSGTQRGRDTYKLLEKFNHIAKREGEIQQAIIAKKFSLSEGAIEQTKSVQRALFGVAYLAKSVVFDWWAKYGINSLAFRKFTLDLLQNPRYEKIKPYLNKLEYDNAKLPADQRVDIDAIKKDIQLMQDISAQTVKETAKSDQPVEAMKEMLEYKLLEYKPDISFKSRNFDRERLQAKALGVKEGMGPEHIERIENFDDFSRELKELKSEINERVIAHRKNPPAGSSDDVLLGEDKVRDLSSEASTPVDDVIAPAENTASKSGEFDLDEILSQDYSDKSVVEASLKETGAELNERAAEQYKRFSSMFGTFQGGKKEMSLIAPQYIDKTFTLSEREHITVVKDYFGGGGSWGLFMASSGQFKNVKKIELFEFNPNRMKKIEYTHQHAQTIAKVLREDKLVGATLRVMYKSLREEGTNGSMGAIGPRLEKFVIEQDTKLSEPQKAAFQYLSDYGNASFGTRAPADVLELTASYVEKIGKWVDELQVKGVEISYKTGDSYALDYEKGSHVLALADPPYYKTKGYTWIDDKGQYRAGVNVKIDTYKKTADLISELKDSGNNVLYTDEAWWRKTKSTKSKKGEDVLSEVDVSDEYDIIEGENAFDMAKRIADKSDHFFVVPSKIAGRHETLGIINAVRKQNGKLPKPNAKDGISTSVQRRTDAGADTSGDAVTDGGVGGANTPDHAGGAQRDPLPKPSDGDEPKRQSGLIDEPPSDEATYTKLAEDLNNNPPDHYELKALEQLSDDGLSFFQNITRKIKEGKLNHVYAKAYAKAKDSAGAKLDELSDELRTKEFRMKHAPSQERVYDIEILKGWAKEHKQWSSILSEFQEATGALGSTFNKMVRKVKEGKELSEKESDLWYFLAEREGELKGHIQEWGNPWGSAAKLHSSITAGSALLGSTNGISQDEEGNFTFDAKAAIGGFALGALAGHVATRPMVVKMAKDAAIVGAKRAVERFERSVLNLTNYVVPNQAVPSNTEGLFYSKLSTVVQNKMARMANGEDVQNMLKKAGVKEEEMVYSGVKKLLGSKDRVSKEELQSVMQANALEIVPVDKISEAETKYAEYTLKGGDNYREVLFTLPQSKAQASEASKAVIDELRSIYQKYGIEYSGEYDRSAYAELMGKEALKEDKIRVIDLDGMIDEIDDGVYKNSHWNEENVLAFTRMKDREIDGKRTLFVEEIQSDWHQEGRKLGYADRGVPDAPFKKTWHEFALKRMMAEAVEKGYEKIAWTTGSQQAERYSLAKAMDTLVYNRNDGVLVGYKDGQEQMFKHIDEDEALESAVGKSVAQKLVDAKNQTTEGIHVLQDTQLKIGGDGMKSFYDKMLVNSANKLFKRYGVKVKQEELDEVGEYVWSMDLSEAAQAQIKKEGMTLYSQAGVGVVAAGTAVASVSNENKKDR